MNFALGTELTNILRQTVLPETGPVNTVLPLISGGTLIGDVLNVSDGVWTGTGAIGFTYQWMRNGLAIPTETGPSYQLAAADDQAMVACQVHASDDDGSTRADAAGVTAIYAAPVFVQQPTISPVTATVGAVFTLTLGAAGANTLLSIVNFNLAGADKSSELNGQSWDSSAAAPGILAFQVMATNSGGSVVSDIISATVTSVSATVPGAIVDGNWSLSDAGAGGALIVAIAAMADNGGTAITAVEYQLDGGSWVDSGLRAAGGFVIPGLVDAQAYDVALRAVNSVGAGLASAAKNAAPGAGNNPTVSVTSINPVTGEIDMTGVSEAGTYFGLVNYGAAVMAGSAIEAVANASTADADASFPLSSGVNTGAYDKSNVAVGTAYFHGIVKNAAGNYSADIPLAFNQPFVDIVAPVLLSSVPSNGAVNQPVGSNISLTFDEDILTAAGQIVLFDLDSSSVVETFDTGTGAGNQGGTISVSGKVVSINPGADLAQGVQFSLRTITNGAFRDAGGNAFTGWNNDNSQLSFGTAVAGAGAVFIGDADSTIWGVNHVLGAGSSSQTPLPASFGPGKYVIAVAVSLSNDVAVLALDGDTATLRSSVVTGSERIAFFDVSIPGGGNGLIELSLTANGDEVGVVVWEVGGRSFLSAVAQYFPNRTTGLPAVLSADTSAGDTVLATVMHNKNASSSVWTGLDEAVPSRILKNRLLAAAHKLSATGGTPDIFQWSPTVDWVGVGAALVVYR